MQAGGLSRWRKAEIKEAPEALLLLVKRSTSFKHLTDLCVSVNVVGHRERLTRSLLVNLPYLQAVTLSQN